MASPNTLALNIPLPKPIMVQEGEPNRDKRNQRMLKRMLKGNSWGKRNGFRKLGSFNRQEDGELGAVPECDAPRVGECETPRDQVNAVEGPTQVEGGEGWSGGDKDSVMLPVPQQSTLEESDGGGE